MGEYLKMADVFVGSVSPKHIDDECATEIASGDGAGNYYVMQDDVYWMLIDKEQAEYAAHAINSHDELVAEVERLRVVVDGVIAASKSMQDRKPLTPWGDGFKECAVSIERAISGVMSGELSVFPRDL